MFRLPGFPALIAFWKILLGPHWCAGILFSNVLALFLAGVYLHRLTRDLSWPRWIRWVVLFCLYVGIYRPHIFYTLNYCTYSSCALIVTTVLCRMCLGACVLKREKFVCFACLFYMGFTRETTLWFFVPLIPLLFVLWRSFGRKAMGSIALLVTATAVPIGTLNFYHWYTLGTPVISLGQGHALSGAFQYFSEIDPNIVKETCFREILPNGGRLDWWTDCVQKMYHGVSGKMASDPAFREQLRYPENALNAAKAKIGKQIERDFFRVALTHPLVLLKTFQLQRMCTVLAEHDLAFGFLFKGFPAVCFFLGALLSIMGALWALRGLPSFFRKKSPLDNRELVAFCVFLHILGFNAANSIIVPSMNYLLHAAILSGFLGWWAIASYTKVYKERKGSPAG